MHKAGERGLKFVHVFILAIEMDCRSILWHGCPIRSPLVLLNKLSSSSSSSSSSLPPPPPPPPPPLPSETAAKTAGAALAMMQCPGHHQLLAGHRAQVRDLLQQAHSGSRSGAQGHVAPTVIVSIEPDVKTPVTTNGNTNASNNADVSETSFIARRTFVIGLALQGVGIFSTQVFIAVCCMMRTLKICPKTPGACNPCSTRTGSSLPLALRRRPTVSKTLRILLLSTCRRNAFRPTYKYTIKTNKYVCTYPTDIKWQVRKNPVQIDQFCESE